MQNAEIAKYLAEIADMMELVGENFFHVRAYRNGSRAVLDYPGNFSKLTIQQMEKVPDIGKGISSKIDTLIKTGALEIHQELRKKVPPAWIAIQSKELARMSKPSADVLLAGTRPVKLLLDKLAKRK